MGKQSNLPPSTITFRYYVHDGVEDLRFELFGALAEVHVAELECCWSTARSSLAGRPFTLDLTSLNEADQQGRAWLHEKSQEGTRFRIGNVYAERFTVGLLTAKTVKRTSPLGGWRRLVPLAGRSGSQFRAEALDS